jgi:hypothetical protein
MTDICDDEIDTPVGERLAVVQTEAAGEQAPLLDSTADNTTEKKGSRGRKTPKQSRDKNEATTQGDAGSESIAPGATTETASKAKGMRASKTENSESGKPTDDVVVSYPNLAAWPVSAGPAPLPAHILTARALGMGPGTKRELAVASYLRDEASQFTLIQVAEALRAVLGGEFNVQRNVVKGLEADGLVTLNKVTTEGVGTSFHLELTLKGHAEVNRWLAEHKGAGLDGTKPTA